MAVMYSQNGVIVRSNLQLGSNIGHNDIQGTAPWYLTPEINLSNASIIEENIVCKATSYLPSLQFHQCGGQWWSNDSTKFIGIAVYIWSNQIEFDYRDNVSSNYEFVTGIPYTLSNQITKNIIYDKISGIATCKIYYDDTLVCTYTKSISDLYMFSAPYSIGGTRTSGNQIYNFVGEIDFNKSYIKLDGKLAWGSIMPMDTKV